MSRRAIPMLTCCILICGCGRFSRPSTVVHSLYMDCTNGEYPKARTLLITELRDNSDGALDTNGKGIKHVCDRITRDNQVADVEIKQESITGDTALVAIDIHFKDETVKLGERTRLVKEDGGWKVSQVQVDQ